MDQPGLRPGEFGHRRDRDRMCAVVIYPVPDADYITVDLSERSAHATDALFAAIPYRQNTRSLYDGRALPLSERERIESVTVGEGLSRLIFTDPASKEAILEYVRAGDRHQFADPSFVNELVSWVRFNKPEAFHTLDGLYSRCSGNPEVPRWLGRRFLTSASAGAESDKDTGEIRSASGLIVIAAARDDKRHWIESGRLYERLALMLTASGVKTSFLNQPVEVAEIRAQLQSHLGLGAALPQLLMRFGYADPMPRSLRRPLSEVLA